MPRIRALLLLLSLSSLALGSSLASADFSTGSTGADGDFTPTGNYQVDLAFADSGPGTGTYDVAHWAVVFNYGTIDVPSGCTVTFKNHPSGAPVIWLATGDVNIAGTVRLNGADGVASGFPLTIAIPGPGGFQGGRRYIAPSAPDAAGLGPGGAPYAAGGNGGGGGYGTAGAPGTISGGGATYGDEYILPLIGGSGGAGVASGSGGSGGGAILIASPTAITLSGTVEANGGVRGSSASGHGSGGAVRLRAPSVTGFGALRALSGQGAAASTGLGRIRVEATTLSLADVGIPTLVSSTTAGLVFPDPSSPTLAATMIESTAIPPDPAAGIESVDAVISTLANVTLSISATNIAPGTTVDVIVVPDGGAEATYVSTPLTGTLVSSTATAAITLDVIRRTEIFLRANTGSGPVLKTLPPVSQR